MINRDDTIQGLRRRIRDLEDTVAELVGDQAETEDAEATSAAPIVETFTAGGGE